MNQLQADEYKLLIEFDRLCTKYNIAYMLSSGTLLGAIRHQGFIPWDDDIDVCMTREAYDQFKAIALLELDGEMFFQDRFTDKDYFHAFAKLRLNNTVLKEQSSAHLRAHQGVWLDIFPMDHIPDDLNLRNKQKTKVSIYHKLISLMLYTFPTEEKGIKNLIKHIMYRFNKLTFRLNPFISYCYNRREYWMKKFNASDATFTNMLSYNYNDAIYESTLIELSAYESLKRYAFESHTFLGPKSSEIILQRLYGEFMTLPPIEAQVSNHFIVS